MTWTPETLADHAAGRLIRRSNRPIRHVFIDSRTPVSEGLFVPIRAARDGHDFIAAAVSGGASALLVEPGRPTPDGDVTIVEVPDTTRALGELARRRREAFVGPVIGITGSNGKTTTRAMIEAVVARSFAPVLATKGNLNNHLGVPLTLLSEPATPGAMVIEMGMSAPGENDWLATIVRPTVHVITSVALEHLEFMQSIEAIAAAEAEPLARMQPGSVVVVPSDEPLLDPFVRAQSQLSRMTFGPDAQGVDVAIVSVKQSERTVVELRLADGTSMKMRLQLFGLHNARNAAAAVAVGRHLGVPVDAMVEALEAVEPVGDRGRVHRLGQHLLIADCYNANPGSMEAALGSIAELRRERQGPLCAVLGDMLELGPTSRELHGAVGERCATADVDALATVGTDATAIAETARECGTTVFTRTGKSDEDIDAVVRWIRGQLAAGGKPGAVLVKGSRGMGLERVVAKLLAKS